MKELNNFIKSKKIDKEYHKKIFDDMVFEKLYTKVDLREYDKLRNQIYWISLLIYRISMINYIKLINNDIDIKKQSINIQKNNLIIFHMSTNISSEICK